MYWCPFMILFTGEVKQLPPVKDTPIYSKNQNSVLSKQGKQVFNHFQEAYILQTCFRQQDKDFLNLLDNVSNKLFHNMTMTFYLKDSCTICVLKRNISFSMQCICLALAKKWRITIPHNFVNWKMERPMRPVQLLEFLPETTVLLQNKQKQTKLKV